MDRLGTLQMAKNGSHHRFRHKKLHGIGPTVAEKAKGKWPKGKAKGVSDGGCTVDRLSAAACERARALRPPRPLGGEWYAFQPMMIVKTFNSRFLSCFTVDLS